MQAQFPVREDISKLKEDIKQEMMVCIFVCVLTNWPQNPFNLDIERSRIASSPA